jgi:hypothetical protein
MRSNFIIESESWFKILKQTKNELVFSLFPLQFLKTLINIHVSWYMDVDDKTLKNLFK